jgi:ribosome-binding factor A
MEKQQNDQFLQQNTPEAFAMRAMDAQNRKADIDAFKERLVKKALTENSQVDVVQLRQ